MTTTTLPPHALAELLESRDSRVQAAVVPPWPYAVCDLCGLLECPADTRVSWTSAWDGGEHTVEINHSHVDGWLTGLCLPDCGSEERYRASVLINIGGDHG